MGTVFLPLGLFAVQISLTDMGAEGIHDQLILLHELQRLVEVAGQILDPLGRF